MSALESLEESSPQQYSLRIAEDLLVQAHLLNIDLDELAYFFAAQIQAMFASPPNYNKFGQTAKVWVMRGFYPGSPLFFKLVVGATDHSSRLPYYAKAHALRVNRSTKKSGMAGEKFTMLYSDNLNTAIVDKMENAFFNAKHEVKQLVKKPRMPRCMSPKGMKVLNYEPVKTKRQALKKKRSAQS